MMYEIHLRHEGLGKYRHIIGRDPFVVEQKAASQTAIWDAMWARREAMDKTRSQSETLAEEARVRTEEASASIIRIENILAESLKKVDGVNWEGLKDRRSFSTPEPVLKLPPPPSLTEPTINDSQYRVDDSFFKNLLFSKSVANKKAEAARRFERDHEKWKEEMAAQRRSWEAECKRLQSKHTEQVALWDAERTRFLDHQREVNEALEQRRAAYLKGLPEAVYEYCDQVLSDSLYPDEFPKEWELEYIAETKLLVVDYLLPDPNRLPSIKEVRYSRSKEELVEVPLSERSRSQLYDGLVYQICLRTFHELIESDQADAITSIVFNGRVRSIDKTNGQETTAYIMSCKVAKEAFSAIALNRVDPKACFKMLKGVGSSRLHSLTPIAPIINLNREDKRFIAPYGVLKEVDDAYNLAAMPWEDFEHLIREVFEKEFSISGGEVKITRTSRDAGVDAVAFDPDPIRGGKIVIQAKRYTSTVGVSAVRDLYGTVMNEGAMKGILVTTADYGPDAYEFIKGKPLTLMNGANLLYMLERHGHRARIDLKEARLGL